RLRQALRRLRATRPPGTLSLRPSHPCSSLHRSPTPRVPNQIPTSEIPALRLCAANRDAIHSNRRHSHSDRHRLTVFAARPESRIKCEIVSYHGDPSQHLGTIPNEGRALDRPRHLTIFDQIGFAGRENELAVGNIDLTSA